MDEAIKIDCIQYELNTGRYDETQMETITEFLKHLFLEVDKEITRSGHEYYRVFEALPFC